MKWEGNKIRELAGNRKIKLQSLAELTNVSRQTVNDWIKGQIPKGNHLLLLCQIFHVRPEAFFTDDIRNLISVPAHRPRMGAKITTETQEEALTLTKDYLNLFKNHKSPELVQIVRSAERNKDSAKEVSKKIRSLSGISRDIPIDYEHTFKLAERLGIYLVFRTFPKTIKCYAFYTRIHGHRVVLVNNSTNIIDLIFPVLHEFVHATRDDIEFDHEYEEEEEKFCDDVANFIQFPEEYVEKVYSSIKGLPDPHKIRMLKAYASSNKHSLYGIIKAIQNILPKFNLDVVRADTKFRKEFNNIGEVIFNGDEPRVFVQKLFDYSKGFMDVIASQIDHISDRRLADLLDFENPLDAKEVKLEIEKLSQTS